MATNPGARRFLGRIQVNAADNKSLSASTDRKSAAKVGAHLERKPDVSFGDEFDSEFVDQLERLEKQLPISKQNQNGNFVQRKNLDMKEKSKTEIHRNELFFKFDKPNKSGKFQSCRTIPSQKKVSNNSVHNAEQSSRNTAQNIEAMLQKGNLDLTMLSMDSPLRISTPDENRPIRKKQKRDYEIHQSPVADSSKVNLFKQIMNLSDSLTDDDLNFPSPKTAGKNEKSDHSSHSASRTYKLKCSGESSLKEDVKREHIISKAREHSISKAGEHIISKAGEHSISKVEKNTELKTNSTEVCKKSAEKDQENLEMNVECNVSVSEHLRLSSWGLPAEVLIKYEQLGITSMFEWQAECLCTGNVLSGSNLVYSAPTSAGKMLVSELLILKRVLETKKKAIVILPFVSIAREKMFYLQNLYQDAGLCVDGYMGSQNARGGFTAVDVAVCTLEKANSLINRLMEEGQIDLLGMVVVDELHMVGDTHRGYLLELLLTKIRYVSAKVKGQTDVNGGVKNNSIQIVGMSATLPNLDLLAKWLDADLYRTDFRPVPLVELMKVGNALYDSTSSKVRDINMTFSFKGDEDGIIHLCLEIIRGGHSVLIFCPTKNWCETLCDTIAREFYGLRHGKIQTRDGFDSSRLLLDDLALNDVLEQLKRSPGGVDKILSRVIPQGVAFHHAGLTFDERDIIEGAFRRLAVRVLVATSTLSSGVNLPARRVIIRTPIFYRTVIDTLTYKQMVGRAGRKGIDTYGESVLICKPSEKSKGHDLMQSYLPPVQSCLVRASGDSLSSSMKRAILEVVVSGVASTPQEVATYAKCTMLAASIEIGNIVMETETVTSAENNNVILRCIDFLVENEFITLRKTQNEDGSTTERYLATCLGSAVFSSALAPDEGITVFTELQKARRCFVLENELHIIYLVTPIYMADQWGSLDWYKYLCYWEKLTTGMKRVAELVGVSEGFLNKAVQGRIPNKTSQEIRTINIHKRFYTALVLHDLVNEMPLTDVATKYTCSKGQLQSLQQGAATFSGMVTVFCNRLGWHALELLLAQFQSRLSFGVQRELVDLVRISMLNAQRARALYNGGLQSVAAISKADPTIIEKLLKSAVPFQSKRTGEGETRWEAEERQKSHCIFVSGYKPLTEHEAAILIVDEATKLLRADLEEMGIQWNPQSKEKVDDALPEDAAQDVKSHQSPVITQSRTIRRSLRTPPAIQQNAKPTSSERLTKRRSLEQTQKSPLVVTGSILSPPPAMLNSSNVSNSGKCNENIKINTKSDIAYHESFHIPRPSMVCKPGLEPIFKSDAKSNHVFTEPASPFVPKAINKSTKNANQTLKICRKAGIVEDTVTPTGITKGSDVRGKRLSIRLSKSSDLNHNAVIAKHNSKSSSIDEENISHEPQLDAYLISKSKCELKKPGKRSNEFDLKSNGETKLGRGGKSEAVHENPQQDTAVELYTEPMDDDDDDGGNHNITDDSFIIDTQTMNLVAQFSPSANKEGAIDEKSPNPQKCLDSIGIVHCESIVSDEGNSLDEGKHLVNSEDLYSEDYMNTTLASPAKDQSPNNLNGMFDEPFDLSSRLFQNSMNLPNNNPDNVLLEFMSMESLLENTCDHEDAMIFSSYMDRGEEDQQKEQLVNGSSENLSQSSKYSAEFNLVKRDDYFSPTNVMNGDVKGNIVAGRTLTPDLSQMGEDVALAMMDSFTNSMFNGSHVKSVNIPSNKIIQDGSEAVECRQSNAIPQKTDNTGFGDNTMKQMDESLTASILNDVLDGNFETQISKNENITLFRQGGDAHRKESDLHFLDDSMDFSPGMAAILDALCDENTSREKQNAKKKKNDHDLVTKAVNSRAKKRQNIEQMDINPKKLRRSGNKSSTSPCVNDSQNDSTASDCVPPTPPLDENVSKSCIYTPQRLVGGVVSLPLREQINAKTPGCEKSLKGKKDKNCNVQGSTSLIASLRTGAIKEKTTLNRSQTGKIVPTPQTEATAICSPIVPSQMLSSLPLTNQSFTIIDVVADKRLFEHFLEEWSTQTEFAICVACEKKPVQPSIGTAIGGKFTKAVTVAMQEVDGYPVDGADLVVAGLAVSWGNRDAYYIALNMQNSQGDPNDSLCPPPLANDLPMTLRLSKVKEILESGKTKPHQQITYSGFALKEQLNVLSKGCGIWVNGQGHDPKVAAWLIDPGEKEKNLHRMVHDFLPVESHLLEDLGAAKGLSSLGLTPEGAGTCRIYAATEVVLVRHLMVTLSEKLSELGLDKAYREIEMPSLITISRMELNGIGFSQNQCEELKMILQGKMSALEEQAYSLAGHTFSLTSTDDVSQVLFVELRLPPNGDSVTVTKTLGPRRGTKRTKQYSTSKDVLEKIKHLHPLPGIILEWRRINSALTKVVFTYQKECVANGRLQMDRVHGYAQCFTATGRVTMHEPNIQNIPKDFNIQLPGVIGESPTNDLAGVMTPATTRRQHRPKTTSACMQRRRSDIQTVGPSYSVSMRHAFVPFKGGLMLAADYSQLELRILAHLSADKKLQNILNSGGDVFKTIAAQWKSVEIKDVTAEDRQHAKQVCYGIIYGIGPKALGEQISVDENDASAFIETFKAKYPGMRAYLKTTVQSCRERGYVTTIMGRRRYLPAIRDPKPHAKAQAERQAVNSTIQGSAADLVKKAMINIDKVLWEKYPDTRITHQHRQIHDSFPQGSTCRQTSPRGAFFVLQLHDELIYEVNEQDIQEVAKIVKHEMESAMMLSVVLPVMVKVGHTWGSLEEMDI